MTGLLDRQLLFVSGKGGTGKTSVAAALAELAVRQGLRTLVCEMDAKGALAATFEVRELSFQPTEVQPGLFGMVMNTEDSLKEYLRLFIRIPLVGRIGPLARTFDFVADAAPGVKEILAIGKLCHEVRERHYDLVIVDAEASGHIVAQIDAPRAIRELVQVGMVRDQTDWMLDILGDRERTGLVVVTTPEEMPVIETIELVDRQGAGNHRRRCRCGHRQSGAAAVVLGAGSRGVPGVAGPRATGHPGRGRRAEGGDGVPGRFVGTSSSRRGRRLPAAAARRRRCSRADGAAARTVRARAGGRRVVSLMADALHEELS